MKIKVGVIFGGESTEHEVSIISALQAIQNMNLEKYEVIPIYIDKKRNWYTGEDLLDLRNYKNTELLLSGLFPITLCNINGEYTLLKTKGIFRKVISKIDIAFPIVHGNNVEDGTLIGYLETIGIPYVGSGVLASALGQDKVIMKQVIENAKLPIVKYTWFYDYEYLNNKEDIFKKIKPLKYPVIVKPASLGSSIGIGIAHTENELDEIVNEAIKYDNKIVVEKLVDNLMEVNASVIGNNEYLEVSEIEEVMGVDEFLSYRDKYIGGKKTSKTKGIASTNRIIPARLDEKTTNEIKELAKKVFQTLNLSSVARIDFLINKKDKKIYINEPNVIPGSLSFYLWKSSNKNYKTLLDELITLAIKKYKNKQKKIYSFDSNILENVNGSKRTKGKLKF